MPATTAPHSMADQAEPNRLAFADAIVAEVTRDMLDPGTARLMLDVAGLTGDSDALAHAKAARYMRDGLRDGDINPRDVEPGYTVGRDEAREDLANYYDREYLESLAQLAAPAHSMAEVSRPSWFDGFLDRFVLNGGMPKWSDPR
jgi:hypothetical protein